VNGVSVRAFRVWLVVILLGAFALRAWNLSAQCLDVDEFTELQRMPGTYSSVAWAEDSMPPLYPVLLKTWLTVCPFESAGRWMSVGIGVATVGVVGWLWAKCFGSALALTTATLLAISPLHIYYSQYVRCYGLLMFWTALAIGALALATKYDQKRHWLLYAISALGGLYTHYYFAIFLGVMSVTFLMSDYGKRWSHHWWKFNLGIGVLALPLVAFVGQDLRFQKSLRDSRPLDVPALGYTYVSMLTGYSIGPSKSELQMLPRRDAIAKALPIAAVVGGIVLSLSWLGARYLRKRQLFSVVVVLAVVPIVVVGVLGGVADVTYNPRFVVWCLLPLLALLAAGIVSGNRTWLGRAAMVALIGMSFLAMFNRQSVAEYQNEDVRSLGKFLQDAAGPPEQVFVTANYMAPLVAHYLSSHWTVLELPTVDSTDEMQATEELVTLAHRALAESLPTLDKFWWVYSRPFHGDPAGEILEDLRNTCALEKVYETARIVLYRGTLSAD